MHSKHNPKGNVTIVGASLSGLYCAYLLAKEGVAVDVYDQTMRDAHYHERTLIVTSEFRNVVLMDHSLWVLNSIHSFTLHSNTEEVHLPLRHPDLIIERRRSLKLLEEAALNHGAKIHRGYRFTGYVPTRDGMYVEFLNRRTGGVHRVKTQVLIGANGAHSDVAQAIGLDSRPTVQLIQAKVALPPNHDPHRVDIWFDVEITPYFLWLIPESETEGVFGLIAADGRSAKPALDKFISRLHLKPKSYQRGQVALYSPGIAPWRQVGSARVLLVGDAAGHVKVTTVGGTVTGFAGANAAVRSVLRGTDYEKELRPLRRELFLHYLIRKALDGFRNRDYDELLRSLNGGAISILQKHSRDRMFPVFWRLFLAQVRLVKPALISLWRAIV